MTPKASLPGSPSHEPCVADVMHRNFVVADPGESLQEAREIMRLARLRHLLVAQDGKVLGVISYRELLEALTDPDKRGGVCMPRSAEYTPVAAAMRSPAATIHPADSLDHAAAMLERLGIGCLPVVNPHRTGGHLVGLLTSSDLLRAAYAPRERTFTRFRPDSKCG